MTGREFSEVDIDLLADYVGGALDGTPDEALVVALIAEDRAWRDAHATLAAGMATVGARLHALGTEPATMPDEIATRLTAALTAAIPLQPTSSGDAGAAESGHGEAGESCDAGTPAGGRRHLSLAPDPASLAPDPASLAPDRAGLVPGPRAAGDAGVETSGVQGAAAPSRARRRLRQWATPVTVAASVLAFAGVGFGQWASSNASNDRADSKATSAYAQEQDTPMIASDGPGADTSAGGAVTDPGAFVGLPSAGQIMTSGVDYRRTSFTSRLPALQRSPAPQVATKTFDYSTPDQRSAAVRPLQRLSVSAALMLCLQAIAREHGGTPITVDTVDYARFEGTPALVVRFTGDDGQWAWVAGPDCGTPGAAADTRYHVKVG